MVIKERFHQEEREAAEMSARWKEITAAGVLAALLGASPVWAASTAPPQAHKEPVSGDQPDNPGALATTLSPALRSSDIRAAMRKVADWQLARVADTPSQDWTYATLYIGFLAASRTLHEPKFQQEVVSVGEHFNWSLGPRRTHADDQAIGQAYLELYRASHRAKEIDPLRAQFDQIMLQPDDPAKPLWWWCDALFMAPPVWSGLAEATSNDKYVAYMNHEWSITEGLLYDKQEHLFSRDSNYLNKTEKNGKKVFWSRGNGWVMGGLVRVLSTLPPNDPSRKHYIDLYRQMAAKVASIQGSDGLWRAGLLDPDSYALPEVSGSAFFTYSIVWGINHHLLDAAKYRPVVEKAWQGMLTHIYSDGRLGCIQAVGEAPGHYKASSSYVFGVGAFLLAGSELDTMSRRHSHP